MLADSSNKPDGADFAPSGEAVKKFVEKGMYHQRMDFGKNLKKTVDISQNNPYVKDRDNEKGS